jgi:hypothetical protein
MVIGIGKMYKLWKSSKLYNVKRHGSYIKQKDFIRTVFDPMTVFAHMSLVRNERTNSHYVLCYVL